MTMIMQKTSYGTVGGSIEVYEITYDDGSTDEITVVSATDNRPDPNCPGITLYNDKVIAAFQKPRALPELS